MLISLLKKYGVWKVVLIISFILSLVITLLLSLFLFFVQGYVEYFAIILSFTFPFLVIPLIITEFSSLILRDANIRAELLSKNLRLEDTIDKMEVLAKLLPICASCKKVRDDEGYWKQIEEYLSNNSEIDFKEELCPSCEDKY